MKITLSDVPVLIGVGLRHITAPGIVRCGLIDIFPGSIDRQLIGGCVMIECFGVVRAVDFHSIGSCDVVLKSGCIIFVQFQHHVGIQRSLDFQIQFQAGQLQHPYSLLQLRRHGQTMT